MHNPDPLSRKDMLPSCRGVVSPLGARSCPSAASAHLVPGVTRCPGTKPALLLGPQPSVLTFPVGPSSPVSLCLPRSTSQSARRSLPPSVPLGTLCSLSQALGFAFCPAVCWAPGGPGSASAMTHRPGGWTLETRPRLAAPAGGGHELPSIPITRRHAVAVNNECVPTVCQALSSMLPIHHVWFPQNCSRTASSLLSYCLQEGEPMCPGS